MVKSFRDEVMLRKFTPTIGGNLSSYVTMYGIILFVCRYCCRGYWRLNWHTG